MKISEKKPWLVCLGLMEHGSNLPTFGKCNNLLPHDDPHMYRPGLEFGIVSVSD